MDPSVSPSVAHYLQTLYEMINKLAQDVKKQLDEIDERLTLLEETVYGSQDVFDADENEGQKDEHMMG